MDLLITGTKTGLDRAVKIVSTPECNAVEMLREYNEIVSKKANRTAFLIGLKNKVSNGNNVGINRLKKHMTEIAGFLGLPRPEQYTSHSGRRTAATFLSNKGASNIQLKALGGWTSLATADGYIARNATMRRDTAFKLMALGPSTSASNQIEAVAGPSTVVDSAASCPGLLAASTIIPGPMSPGAPAGAVTGSTAGAVHPRQADVNITTGQQLQQLFGTANNCSFTININYNNVTRQQ